MAEAPGDQLDAAAAAGATERELGAIAELRARAAEFAGAVAELESWEPAVRDTELEAEWRRLLERGRSLRAKIEAATRAIDDALRWVRGAIGLDGLRAASGLGVVWFIPMAAVTAAVAALGWWLNDYAKFARKFREQQRIAAELRAGGVHPIEAERQAAAAVASTVPGWLAPLATPFGLTALALGALVLWRASR